MKLLAIARHTGSVALLLNLGGLSMVFLLALSRSANAQTVNTFVDTNSLAVYEDGPARSPFRTVTRGFEQARRIRLGSLANSVIASNATTPVFRGVPPRAPLIYRERVNGVVLIASTKTVGTGVLVSAAGDIVTNEHIVREAHKARGEEWVAVWFKPPNSARPVRDSFLLAKVVQVNQGRDLAHIRLSQVAPQSATVIPLGNTIPDVGQEVFTIGHPKTHLWSFTNGIVSQIRPDYQWKYADGVQRRATAIQTQAPINSGQSGGPLLNDEGKIVGIVVGAAAEAEGVYFAVAVQHVRELLPR